MWVMSQDKKTIVDVQGLHIYGTSSFTIEGFMCGHSVNLGRYKTLEKAMQVLRQFKDSKDMSYNTFYMPED